jgi:hypothetical protein
MMLHLRLDMLDKYILYLRPASSRLTPLSPSLMEECGLKWSIFWGMN